ncbi:MAG: ABC transporter substrate-binding protein, partial [Deltaproteobacteria bacterium]|nr:ABC transporter substrate-binding protein [Deltaproteobacteria bacterium]
MKKVIFFSFVLVFLFLGWSIPPIGLAAEKPLIIGFEGDAATLDPHARSETTTTTVQRHVYENLIGFDENLKIVPELAESWKLIDDNTWEFKLRKGVKFHNGEPMNAAAVKFSLERCKTHPKSQYKHMIPDYKEIQIVDDNTIRLITKSPTPEALIMLENVSIVPPKMFQEWDKKDYSYL